MRPYHFPVVVLLVAAVPACGRPAATKTDQAPAAVARAPVDPNPSKDLAFVCPMDTDVRSASPGKCPRCGMALVAGIPDPAEFRLDMRIKPAAVKPNEPVSLEFLVFDPWKDKPVDHFAIVHEKLFHAFIVSRDLQFFLHDHPTWENGVFRYTARLPRPGMYRVLADFYPEASMPQLLPKTLFVAGPEAPPARLSRDYVAKEAENLKVALSISPEDPIAGVPAQMQFSLEPGDGIQKYLGAWGHMLAASEDLIDMIHTHPFIADGSPNMLFNLVFPRAGVYRVWVQFQRNGVVNTAHFDIPVKPPHPVGAT